MLNIEQNRKPLTSKQVLLRIVIIFAVAESLIMLILGVIPDKTNTYFEVIVDTALLVALSTPLIYFWVIKPFVTSRNQALAEASRLAHIDPLTQLANRRLLSSHLEKELASIARHKLYGALLLLDLDHFKPINDGYGHDAGDAVLTTIARRILSLTRTEDVVARLGGDEFVVLTRQLDPDKQHARDKANLIAKNLLRLVSEPLDYYGTRLQVTASIGVCMLGERDLDSDTAISHADQAMYKAKQAGRGCTVFFES